VCEAKPQSPSSFSSTGWKKKPSRTTLKTPHINWRTALKHKLMLGVISAMLGALLQGCAADKHPSQEETNLANAAKDVTIPL
jgi:hypothetical protein